MKKRLTVVLVSILFVSSLAAGAWEIRNKDEPLSHSSLSNTTDTKQLVQLVDTNGNPVSSEELAAEGYDFGFRYNSTNSTGDLDEDVALTGDMKNLVGGYYYADFQPGFTKGIIEYELGGTSPEINLTEKNSVGNNTVDLQTDFSTMYKAGKGIEVEVGVTDEWNNSNEDGSEVYVYFTNGTWTGNMVQLGYNTNKDLYTNNVELPRKANTSYVMHVNATTPGASYSNAEGSQSVLLETYPSVKGELQELNASEGCGNTSFFSACERDATINTTMEIIASEAQQVELDLLTVDRSNSAWVELDSIQLQQDGKNWTGSLDIPDLNTSKHEKKVILRYNATNNARQFILTRNITYNSYLIRDKSSPTTFKGSDYSVEILFAKSFTRKPLNETRLKNISVTLDDPDGDEISSFEMGDMSYDENEGLFKKTVNIPTDVSTGTSDTSITSYDLYGERKTRSSGFTVEDIEATFSATDDLSVDISKRGNYSYNVTVTNQLGSENSIEAEVTGDIADFTEVNGGENITLSDGESADTTVEFDIDHVEDNSGEIEFSDPDASYNQTTDVDITAPDCDQRTGILCLNGLLDNWNNVSRSERGTTSSSIDLTYFGHWNKSTDITTEVTGNVSQYLTVEPESITGFNDTQQITLNYTANIPGYFTGNITISASNDDRVNVLTSFNSSIESTDTGISASSPVEIGYLPSGEAATKDVEVTNTGQVDITALEASSSAYSVEIESVSIAADESETVELTFDSVTEESGTIELSGTTSVGTTTTSISVTAEPVPDYSSEADTLEERITSLSSETEDDDIQTKLEGLQTEISNIKSEYDQGNYQEAEQKYDTVSSELDSIEETIRQPSETPEPPGGGTEPPKDTGGGFPMLMVAAVLFVLLLIGFVAYTSIVPEEGDPLYNVLG